MLASLPYDTNEKKEENFILFLFFFFSLNSCKFLYYIESWIYKNIYILTVPMCYKVKKLFSLSFFFIEKQKKNFSSLCVCECVNIGSGGVEKTNSYGKSA